MGRENYTRKKVRYNCGDTNIENDFDATVEWDKFAVDTFSNLGTHTAVCASAE